MQDAADKLNLIGLQFEEINSPRYINHNHNTETKRTADTTAKALRQKLVTNRPQQIAITNFTDTYRANHPTLADPKIL